MKRLSIFVIFVAVAATSCRTSTVSEVSEDRSGPKNEATAIQFEDFNPRKGVLGGTIRIVRAKDETDLTEYSIYWGSSENKKLTSEPIEVIRVTGADISFEFSEQSGLIPAGATHLMVYSKDSYSEMKTGKNIAIKDLDVSFETKQSYAGETFVRSNEVGSAWEKVENASGQTDAKVATLKFSNAICFAQAMYSKGFAFNLPNNAKILGFEFLPTRKSLNGMDSYDDSVVVGSKNFTEYPGDLIPKESQTSSIMIWGPFWTVQEINSPMFNVVYKVRSERSCADTVEVDSLALKVYYTSSK